ncbi:GNAT family N-acetyltransferase [Natronolimnohabitans innermongolicus]|uniref:N-acetyltransferase GCN5 n=1 Tax=Natronolimnohabitans innermongolicus JCM 12255 TaxID=1227499 RepID=L9XBD4_9EURY|nr:GNAT family N-acetyltransferase [Natronolimnohabitans innermongolicus]ELY58756.1 N-acetyltransferase GCN5 [Natronolimnohabitans innermongolicus JCM 12255]
MHDLEVRVADTDGAREDAFAVRRDVFVVEQGVDETIEYDDHDATATHFVAYDTDSDADGDNTDGDSIDDDPAADGDGSADETGNEPIGAARLREYEPGVGKVERVAVLESSRETGVGRAVMEAVEDEARAQGFESLKLHSQTRAAGFYRSLGYEKRGEEFEEAGIPHVEMRKSFR